MVMSYEKSSNVNFNIKMKWNFILQKSTKTLINFYKKNDVKIYEANSLDFKFKNLIEFALRRKIFLNLT